MLAFAGNGLEKQRFVSQLRPPLLGLHALSVLPLLATPTRPLLPRPLLNALSHNALEPAEGLLACGLDALEFVPAAVFGVVEGEGGGVAAAELGLEIE